MQVLEIIKPKNDKQQLNEALPFLAYAAGTIVLNYLGGLAVDKVAQGIRAWSDDLDIKNYKPTGSHMPDETRITSKNGKERSVYNAKTKKWGVEEKVKGKWQPFLNKNGNQVTAKIDANALKTAIKNKTLSFGNKKAVLMAMQAAHIASGGTAAKAAFAKSGNFLQDLINKEEGNLDKAGKARLAGKTRWGLIGRTAGAIFSRRSFQILGVLMPVALVINAKRLQAWYDYKSKYGQAENPLDPTQKSGSGWPVILDDGTVRATPYNDNDYDNDIRRLRAMLVAASTAWMVTMGVAALVQGIMMILPFAEKKNKVIEAVDKKNFGKALTQTLKNLINPTKWPGLIGKVAKVATGAASAGLVYGAFDRNFAEQLAGKMADIIMSKPLGYEISPEEYYSELAEVLDLNWDAGMQIIGLGTRADDRLAKAKDKAKDENPLAKPPTVDDNDNQSGNTNTSTIDKVTKKDDFWNN